MMAEDEILTLEGWGDDDRGRDTGSGGVGRRWRRTRG